MSAEGTQLVRRPLITHQPAQLARPGWRRALRPLWRNGLVVAGLTIVAIMVLLALFAEMIAPRDPTAIDMGNRLLPPSAEGPGLSDEHIAAYEAALDALQAGKWDEAFALLHRVPAEDRVKDFLTVFIARHRRVPPTGWDGVIDLAEALP